MMGVPLLDPKKSGEKTPPVFEESLSTPRLRTLRTPSIDLPHLEAWSPGTLAMVSNWTLPYISYVIGATASHHPNFSGIFHSKPWILGYPMENSWSHCPSALSESFGALKHGTVNTSKKSASLGITDKLRHPQKLALPEHLLLNTLTT